VITCPEPSGLAGSCLGSGINHNKFFLFSKLSDGSEKVVVQSSANLTNPQIREFNNMVILRHDSQTFDAYMAYWEDMALDTMNLNYYWNAESKTGTRVFFSPRNNGSGHTGVNDTVVELLDEVVRGPGTEIHVAMALWSDARPEIARRLVAMKNAGCTVRVIVNQNSTGAQIFQILEQGGVPVTRLEVVHSKYMLIKQDVGDFIEKIVVTGSHNYTSPALRSNDETLLLVKDPLLYNSFLQDWNKMLAHPLAQ
ncbi:MAG: phospholipase D-like domain-containing protein, partial [Limisphaerales bacterium]